MTQNVKVLYIMAYGRSGTTILDNILGEIDGFFSAGELRFLWERGVVRGWQCGCRRDIPECPVWSDVLESLRGSPNGRWDATDITRVQHMNLRARNTRRLLKLSERNRDLDPDLQRYAALMTDLYRAVADRTASSVVVDSSKIPSDAAFLSMIKNIDPFVVHVVRDSRGVAHSWNSKKRGLSRQGIAYSTVKWDTWNLAGEAVRSRLGTDRSMLLRYEDFVAAPDTTLAAIRDFVGESDRALPKIEGGRVLLSENHSVSGNPSRFATGAVQVRADERWKTEMTTPNKIAATCLTWPLLAKYGYKLRV